jgi:hypothetical protein
MSQERDDIVRNDDGTIDIRFYAQRAMVLRRAARVALMPRVFIAIGCGCRAVLRRLAPRSSGTGARPRLPTPLR